MQTSCHKTSSKTASPSDEHISHVMTYGAVLKISCRKMNIGVAFHRHVPCARDVKPHGGQKRTCRIQNSGAVSPGDEHTFHAFADD